MNCYKVMIVDDEAFVINDILSLYNWEENGFSLCATAANSRQALKPFRD